MLDRIALEAHRWTRGLDRELVLVAPVTRAGALPIVAVARGRAAEAEVGPARVFAVAVALGGEAVVLAHNHPGGSGPSPSDRALTRRLTAAGAVLGVPLLAHLVVTEDGWFDCLDGECRLRRWSMRPAA